MMRRMLDNWWSSGKTMGRGYAIANIAVGVACLILAGLDIRLGLGSFGRWLLALPFGVVPLVWGLVALRFGSSPATARPLRLAGDIALWGLVLVFTVLALALDPPEYGPLVTLVAIVMVTVTCAVINGRRSG